MNVSQVETNFHTKIVTLKSELIMLKRTAYSIPIPDFNTRKLHGILQLQQ